MDLNGPPIAALLFDKDGTLFDFELTWSAWASRALMNLAAGDLERARVMADALGYDLDRGAFLPSSPVIAGTLLEQAEILAPFTPDHTIESLARLLHETTMDVPQRAVTDLDLLFKDLTARGLPLGIATNDGEAPATTHLKQAGVAQYFTFIAGYDSGFGAKPSPGQLLGFADHIGQDPAQIAMVGDSTHDLMAGQAAGMRCIGVLTGLASRADLAPYADVVLEDIGHIPALLDAKT